MNIGLFGGTFNPIHNGHLETIAHVKKQYAFDQVVLIPSAHPPHKPGTNLAPALDRFEMVRKAIQPLAGFRVSDKELVREGPSFTIDTIKAFQAEENANVRFFLLMGSDAFLDIATWERNDQIFDAIDIIIMLRKPWDSIRSILSFIDETISKGYTFIEAEHRFTHRKKHDIHLCDVPRIDISSSLIRKMRKENQSIENLVPAPVNDMIHAKELYI